ncbi:MAG TPA: Uma2 family endonuclease [Thermoanaerobaculia bacterium]|jgi:Uma2 family endonuclease
MTSVISKLTYDQFQTLPRDGSKRFELIEGEVFVTPSPNTKHQRAVRKLLRALDEFVEKRGLGEVFIAPYDIVFSKWTALDPDLLFIRKERLSIITDANVQGVPDLVIEILSPSNKEYDRETKMRAYEKAGVPEIWYFDPEDDSAEVLSLGADGRYVVTAELSGNAAIVSRALPGFSLTLGDVFAS